MSQRPILLIDGLNLFMRHFVVNPSISDQGDHIGGVVGFLKSLADLSNRVGPTRVIVVWESGGSPRRRAIYSDYKKNRRPQKLNRYYGDDIPDTVENRSDQLSLLVSFLKHAPIQQMYIPDCEADDVIAYIAKNSFSEERIVIVSSDKDLYQLLSKKIVQFSPGQKKFITSKDVKEKFQISAENFCTARCFVGDKSDGITGVPRAGFASMAKRFPELSGEEFVSVDSIVKKSQKMIENSKIKLYTNIVEYEDIAKRNWKLMYLQGNSLSGTQVSRLTSEMDEFVPSGNKIKLIKSLNRYGINNFDVDGFFVALKANIWRK